MPLKHSPTVLSWRFTPPHLLPTPSHYQLEILIEVDYGRGHIMQECLVSSEIERHHHADGRTVITGFGRLMPLQLDPQYTILPNITPFLLMASDAAPTLFVARSRYGIYD